MASADKFGIIFTIVFTAAVIGVMSSFTSDTSVPDRPGAEQQTNEFGNPNFEPQKPGVPPNEKPPPTTEKPPPEKPAGAPMKESEYCWVIDKETGEKVKDGFDNDGDGWIDEPDPLRHMPLGPHPGVDWDYCDLSMYDRVPPPMGDGRTVMPYERALFDFTDEDLSDATIRHATARGTIFDGTMLHNAQFGHNPADFTTYRISPPHTDASGAHFIKAQGNEAYFGSAPIGMESEVPGVTLNNAVFDGARMMYVNFDYAGMEDVSMQNVYMPEGSFVWSNIIHSELMNANMKYSDMTHVNLESTDLSNALLAQVTLDQGLLVDAWFTNAFMEGSTLCNVDGSAGGAIDRISNFENAKMMRTVISGNFQDASFEDTDFTNAQWNNCDPDVIEISQLQGTNFHNADFHGVYIPCGMTDCPPGAPFVYMFTGPSPISGIDTDTSCLHHPFCLLLADDSSAPAPPPPPMSVTSEMALGSSVPGCEETMSCYLPAHLIIGVGGTVTWDDVDTASHTVTSGTSPLLDDAGGPSGMFDSGLIYPGSSFSYTFEEAGSYDYYCIVHPWMTGMVEVVS